MNEDPSPIMPLAGVVPEGSDPFGKAEEDRFHREIKRLDDLDKKKRRIGSWLGLIEDARKKIDELSHSQSSIDVIAAQNYESDIKKWELFIKNMEEEVRELEASAGN